MLRVINVLKALERIGDYSGNIAEHLVFILNDKNVRYIKAEHLSSGFLD